MISTKIYSTLLLCLSFSLQALAIDHLMYIGAGGEEKNKVETIFDSAIKNMGNYVNRTPGLKVDVALNGGHSKTEALIKDSFIGAETKTDFRASDYERLIESYKNKLNNNEMVAGDQMMIYIDSHGARKLDPQNTHNIATSGGSATNLDNLSGSTMVNLDQLKSLRDLARSKGVKMAIIDTSCHSGSTLDLADENTCVISSTGPNHYGYSSYSERFTAAMSSGKNLEDLFLDLRKDDSTPALPMISTPAGREATNILYDKITPFLYHFDSKNDKLTPYLKKNRGNESQCIANFNSLMDTINAVEELNTKTQKILWWKTKIKKVNLTKLKNLVSKYQSSMRYVEDEVKKLDIDRMNKVETFKTNAQRADYSWREILTTDFQKSIDGMKTRLAKENVDSNKELIRDLISVYTQAMAKKEELLKNHPDLSLLPIKEEAIKKSIDSNFFTAAAIGVEERKLYSALYKKSAKANPCKDFKLR